MLKLLFWGLLLANGALFAFHQGYLDSWLPEAREPARMAKQFNADKIKTVSASAALSVTALASARAELTACTEIGNFSEAEATLFEARLAGLVSDDRLLRRKVPEPERYLVYIPPQGGKDGADKKLAELKRLGVKDVSIVRDETPLRWGISLGTFATEEAARAQLATVSRQGVRSARIGGQNKGTSLIAFQIRQFDAAAKSNLDKIKADFAKQEMRNCAAE